MFTLNPYVYMLCDGSYHLIHSRPITIFIRDPCLFIRDPSPYSFPSPSPYSFVTPVFSFVTHVFSFVHQMLSQTLNLLLFIIEGQRRYELLHSRTATTYRGRAAPAQSAPSNHTSTDSGSGDSSVRETLLMVEM